MLRLKNKCEPCDCQPEILAQYHSSVDGVCENYYPEDTPKNTISIPYLKFTGRSTDFILQITEYSKTDVFDGSINIYAHCLRDGAVKFNSQNWYVCEQSVSVTFARCCSDCNVHKCLSHLGYICFDNIGYTCDSLRSWICPQENLSMAKVATNLMTSSVKIAKSGFATVDEATLSKRKEICNKCQYWQPTGNLGFGKCLKCGCTKYKQNFSVESCPLKKW